MKLSLWWLLLFCLAALVCASRGQDDEAEVELDDEVEAEDVKPAVEKVMYVQPQVKGNSFLSETFESESDLKKRWVVSEAKKDNTDENIAKYDGQWKVEAPSEVALEGDSGLVLKSRAKHHAVSVKLEKPYEFAGKPFVVQYEVKFQNGQECGGAYIKLLTNNNRLDLKSLTDKTPYTIMFGPDKCGNDNKLHFIFRHKNPVTGEFEEKHANKPTATLDQYFTDKKSHLYTLVVSPDNSFEVFVDRVLINSGSLLEDVSPPVNPPKEITDPNDKKPEDWDEREKIPDPEAEKPEDWDETQPEMITDPDASKPAGWLDDEPELIPDPDSEMPEDWEEDIDGEWEPPQIQNPACEDAPGCGDWVPPQIKNPLFKGKWKAPMIDNPNYKGKWKARKIANPDYFEDLEPYKMTAIGALGLELWSMSDDILFDNFLITDDKAVADDWASDSWEIKRKQEQSGGSSARSVVDAIMDATNERPWLWAVFVLVVLLPVVLVIVYCCMPSSSPKPEEIRAEAKKTDAPSKDDEYKEDDDEEDDEAKQDEANGEEASKEDNGKGAGDVSRKTRSTRAKKSDLESEEQDDNNEADNEDDGANKEAKSSPRRRKTRARKE